MTENVILPESSSIDGGGSGEILSINGKSFKFSKLTTIFCSEDKSSPSEAITPKVALPVAFAFGYTVYTLSTIL